MAEQKVNRQSLNYILGRIEERLNSGDQVIGELRTAVNDLVKAIAELPCGTHDERLKVVEGNRKRVRTFWDDFKLVIISCVVTAILTTLGTLAIVH